LHEKFVDADAYSLRRSVGLAPDSTVFLFIGRLIRDKQVELLVEDSADDATLTLRELKRGNLNPQAERVDTLSGLSSALERGPWDLVISDHTLPGFDSFHVLQLLNDLRLGILADLRPSALWRLKKRVVEVVPGVVLVHDIDAVRFAVDIVVERLDGWFDFSTHCSRRLLVEKSTRLRRRLLEKRWDQRRASESL